MLGSEQMVDHYPQNVTHAVVSHRIDHLLTASLRSQHARGTKQSQMMTYKRSREAKLTGDATSRYFTVHARHDDR